MEEPRPWEDRRATAAEAVALVRPGDRVFVGSACATPRTLVAALEGLHAPPKGVTLVHFLTDRVAASAGSAPTCWPPTRRCSRCSAARRASSRSAATPSCARYA